MNIADFSFSIIEMIHWPKSLILYLSLKPESPMPGRSTAITLVFSVKCGAIGYHHFLCAPVPWMNISRLLLSESQSHFE